TGVTQVHPSTGEFGRFEDRGGRVRGTGWFGAHSCPHWVGAWSVKQGSCVLTHDPTAPFTLDLRSRTPPMTRYRKTFGPKGQISGIDVRPVAAWPWSGRRTRRRGRPDRW